MWVAVWEVKKHTDWNYQSGKRGGGVMQTQKQQPVKVEVVDSMQD
jgi:hypothetical protein